jgi:signal transduction histidine kinase
VIARIAKRPVLVDGAVVAGLLVLAIGGAVVPMLQRSSAPMQGQDILAVVSLLAIILPLAWRRRYPTAVMGVCAVLYFVRLGLGFPVANAANLAQLVAVYSVGTFERRPFADRVRQVAGVAISIAFLVSAAASRIDLASAISSVAWWTAAAFFGEAVYLREKYHEAIEERAKRMEAEQAERDRRAVQDERARIAREFHDIWAHTLSVVVVQAEAAEEVFDASPEQAREALGRIRRAGRQALAEVRRLIASDLDAARSDRLNSVPTLADVGALADELRASGLPVSLSIDGPIDRIPADINVSGYRIIQQALTNALTHGGPGVTARVDVVSTDDQVRIDIVDDGRGTKQQVRPARQGRGLIGMRERAALFGGELVAGPEPGGGFGVHARIPVGADR